MNKNKPSFAVIVAGGLLIVLILGLQSIFVVRTDQFAIVTEFGKPIRTKMEPGLFFKIPLIQEVSYIDKRIQGWEDTQRDTKTVDGRQVDYTIYGRWRIVDPLLFLETLQGNEKKAYDAMDKLVKDNIQKALRASPLAAIVHETKRDFKKRAGVDLKDIYNRFPSCDPSQNPKFQSHLTEGEEILKSQVDQPSEIPTDKVRSQILAGIRDAGNDTLRSKNGIEVLDLHFKYLNYSMQVQSSIIGEITAERENDKKTYERVSQACIGYINRRTEESRGRILGAAHKEVREIGGDAVAKAIAIKSAAYAKGEDFYLFLEKLELLKNSLKNRTRLVLSADSPILELLKDRNVLSASTKKGAAIRKMSKEVMKELDLDTPAPKPAKEKAAPIPKKPEQDKKALRVAPPAAKPVKAPPERPPAPTTP